MTSFSISHEMRKKQISLRRLLLIALTAACLVNQAHAVDPNRSFSQYVRDQWSAENGFSGGRVNAFAQTPDGYLWIGTARGLFRFDGLNFTTAQQLDPSSPAMTNVLGLTTDVEGNLWVRMQGSIFRYRNGAFEDVTPELSPGSFVTAMSRAVDGGVLLSNLLHGEILYGRNGFKSLVSSKIFMTALVIAIAQTKDGKIWIGTRGDGLFCLSNGQITSITDGLPDRKINSLLPMDNGTLWIGTDNGIAFWNGSAISTKTIPTSLTHVQISTLTQDRDANVWVGTSRGLFRLNINGVISSPQSPDNELSNDITTMLEDREGNLWIGGTQGIERLRDSTFVTYSIAEGLPSEASGPIYADPEGRIWFGPPTGGLYWMQGGKVTTILKAGQGSDVIYSITGSNDDLWVGRQQGGLTHFVLRPSVIMKEAYTQMNGLAQNSVYAVHENRDGTVWAGTLSGGVSALKDGVFRNYTTADGLASNSISAIEEGPDNTMWFATPGGLTELFHGRLQTYTVHDGLPSDDVISLLQSDGKLWIGTANGLAVLSSNKIQSVPMLPESLREPILGLAEDRKGSLWITTPDHVLKVNRGGLLNGALREGDVREYGLADGLHGIEGVRRNRSVIMDQRGQIWLSLNRGVSVVDPARISESLPAIPNIEAMLADGAVVATQGQVRIPGPSRRITFSYTGLSLSVPERIRFRYMLEGFDRGWSDSTAARQAIYTNLGPGLYRFRVTSSNSDGQWHSPEASLSFKIEPVFWQSWWFQISCLLSLGLIVLMLYNLRMRQLSRQMQTRLEERLEERERIARDLHDTLLQGFVSASMQLDVANDRLAADSPAKPIVERVLQLMRQVSEEGRNTIRSLRSSDHESHDLEQDFSRIAEEVACDDKVDFRVIVQGLPHPLHPVIQGEIYRIGREAVINAFHHANASRIELEVEYLPRNLRIVIRDNGCGIDPHILDAGREGHWGLSGMRERADKIGAKLGVKSRSGTGTEIDLSVPGNVAYQSVSSFRWPKWFTRLFSAKTETEYPSTVKGENK